MKRHPLSGQSTPKSSLGFTLLELMISMSLGLFLVAGAGQMLMTSEHTYRFNRDLGWMQENAKYALSLMTKEIRMAGYWGCNSGQSASTFTNTLNTGTGDWYLNFENAINGYDGDDAAFPNTVFPVADQPILALGAELPDSDVVIISRGDGDSEVEVASHDTGIASFDVVGNHDHPEGKILSISNCAKTAIFQKTAGATPSVVFSGNTETPGNCTEIIRFPNVCSNAVIPGNPAYDFDSAGEAKLMAAMISAYYIRTSDSGLPVLFKQTLDDSAALEEKQMAQGIENIQIRYGEDVNGDDVVDRYVSADQVTDWGEIHVVKLYLLMRSLTEVTAEAQNFRFAGSDYTSTDKYFRQEFMSTTTIRNRG